MFFFVNSGDSDENWRIVSPNEFAAKSYKQFPPHLNNVSTLPCETWNAYRARATIELVKQDTLEIIPPLLWHRNSPDLNPFNYSVCAILQEKVYKTRITDLDSLTMPLKNYCCNDDVIQLGFRSQLLFHSCSISYIL